MFWIVLNLVGGAFISVLLLGFHFQRPDASANWAERWMDRETGAWLASDRNDVWQHPWSLILATIANAVVACLLWPELFEARTRRYDGTSIVMLLVHLPATMSAHWIVKFLRRERGA